MVGQVPSFKASCVLQGAALCEVYYSCIEKQLKKAVVTNLLFDSLCSSIFICSCL